MTYTLPILMGSGSDAPYAAPCVKLIRYLGIRDEPHVMSAHKRPEQLLELVRKYERDDSIKVLLGIIGRSNALTPISDFAMTKPVVVYHATVKEFPYDVWSSLRMPSGIAHAVTIYPEAASLLCAKIIAGYDLDVRGRVMAYITNLRLKNKEEDELITTQIEVELAKLGKG